MPRFSEGDYRGEYVCRECHQFVKLDESKGLVVVHPPAPMLRSVCPGSSTVPRAERGLRRPAPEDEGGSAGGSGPG